MSARTFWAIFTISILLLMETIIMKYPMRWLVTQEITSQSIPYTIMYPEYVPPESETSDEERYITNEDLQDKQFSEIWSLLYNYTPGRAIQVTASMLVVGLLIGFVIASVAFRHLVSFGDRLSQLSTMDKIAAFIGGIIGISVSAIFLNIFRDHPIYIFVGGVLITYGCIKALMSMKEELKIYFPSLSKGIDLDRDYQKPKILDTNVIIDGRIADICSAGFVEGQILVPSFVLQELQHIADSADSVRRARGRRGLDILNQMRKELDIREQQCGSVDPNNTEEVDDRLVKLAKSIDGIIITNDFNLNKVAEFQGMEVLNINELANALKPVVLPGEELTVSILKEGKETNQGIAYLDDGTMIVVEGAKKHIGETVEVVVASVLQTIAGKMIFANIKSLQEEEDKVIDRNVRNYSGFRPRRKTQ